jgi:pyruvate carboxylase subunit B
MRDVVERGGFGTSVTPVSQFYFQQAFNNVMFGDWKRIAEPYGQMVLGYFGKTPVPPDPEIVKIASEQLDLQPTTQSPLERNDADPTKGAEQARKQLSDAGLDVTDENTFIVATCKDKGMAYLQGKGEIGVRKVDKTPAMPAVTPEASGPASYTVNVDGKSFNVNIDDSGATVDGRRYSVSMSEGATDSAATAAAGSGDGGTVVTAEMPGKVIRLLVHIGDHVEAGEGLLVLEAMKMEMPITAPVSGTVADISVSPGDQVATGDELAHIG